MNNLNDDTELNNFVNNIITILNGQVLFSNASRIVVSRMRNPLIDEMLDNLQDTIGLRNYE